MSVGLQIHVGRDMPRPEKMISDVSEIKASRPWMRLPAGFYDGRIVTAGIWTSSYETAYTEGWPWFLGIEEPGWLGQWGWLLQPREGLTVFDIDGGAAASWFVRRYSENERTADHLDWRRIAAEWDGVRCSAPYDPAVKFMRDPLSVVFYSWDCEATWWPRWPFVGRPVCVPMNPGKVVNEFA